MIQKSLGFPFSILFPLQTLIPTQYEGHTTLEFRDQALMQIESK